MRHALEVGAVLFEHHAGCPELADFDHGRRAVAHELHALIVVIAALLGEVAAPKAHGAIWADVLSRI